MPHLAFYAGPDDVVPVIRFVLEDAKCVAYQAYSIPDESLRSFATSADVLAAFGDGSHGLHLSLYRPDMRGVPRIERIELSQHVIPGKSWRERVSGWGMISLQFGAIRDGTLEPSDTNHNSQARARRWESTHPGLGHTADWDFEATARVSRSINRHISVHLAGRKEGSRIVLPGAQALVDAGWASLGAA